jgi:hypothetical protein
MIVPNPRMIADVVRINIMLKIPAANQHIMMEA